MEKMFFKMGLRSFLPMFFLLVGMAFAGRMEAQTTIGGNSPVWFDPTTAVAKLVIKVDNDFKPFIGQQTPGSPQFNYTMSHMVYYKACVSEILDGATVPVALKNALASVSAGPSGSDVITGASPLPKVDLDALYQDAVKVVSQ